MSNHDVLIKELIEALKKFKCVKAIAYFGAHALGYADQYSDIDIYAYYVGNPPSSKKKEKLWNELNIDVKKPYPIFDRFFINNEEAGQIFWLEISKVQKNVDLFKEGFYNEFEEEVCKTVQNIKIIWDPKNILKRWKRITKYPEGFRKQKCRMRLSGVPRIFFDVEMALKRHNIFFAEYRVNQGFEVILKAIFALNRRYYFYPKWLSKDFRRFKLVPKNSLRLITKFSTSKNLSDKIKILKELFLNTKKIVEKEVGTLYLDLSEYHDEKWYDSQIKKIISSMKDI